MGLLWLVDRRATSYPRVKTFGWVPRPYIAVLQSLVHARQDWRPIVNAGIHEFPAEDARALKSLVLVELRRDTRATEVIVRGIDLPAGSFDCKVQCRALLRREAAVTEKADMIIFRFHYAVDVVLHHWGYPEQGFVS
jgi:hypothetical protein